MEPLENIYAVLGCILIFLLVLALLVAALLPKENRNKVSRRLRRLQF